VLLTTYNGLRIYQEQLLPIKWDYGTGLRPACGSIYKSVAILVTRLGPSQ
jgi:hypothetical protein